VRMISSCACRVAVDDLQTTNTVPNLDDVVVRAQRNSQYAILQACGRDCNNMGRRLADCDGVEDGSAGPVNLVDPLAKPVAVADDIEREVGPHVVRVIPHAARLHPIDFALEGERCCVEHGDRCGLEDAAPIPLVSYPLELGIYPHLAQLAPVAQA
jgi:hypothetical protein